MSLRSAIIAVAMFAVAAALLAVAVARRYATPAPRTAAARVSAPAPTPPAPGRKIKAHLYYVSEDGTRLVAEERDVPFGADPVQQATEIVKAEIAPAADPLVSPIPPGTSLRALFVTDRGEAFVDLSREFQTAHTGGTTDEILSVYAIVDALTANLPAVASVQILVDGKAVETAAGHVDLRRPLAKNLAWVQ
jgi:spore germination protein GerM